MNLASTSCPECGEDVRQGESCPHCGAELDGGPDFEIEVGDEHTFRGSGRRFGLDADEVEATIRIEGEWAELVSKTVYTARAVACVATEGDAEVTVEDLPIESFLVEASSELMPRGLEELPGEGTLPLRRPVAQMERGDATLFLYSNDGGVSLAEFVALADRELTVRQVAGVFDALLESLSELHEVGILHLYLNPELVRVRPHGSDEGVPFVFGEEQPPGEETSILEDPEPEEGDEEDRDDAWGTSEYDETRPQEPLGRRTSEMDTPDISSLAEESSSLDEETSEVNEAGMPGENWLRTIGIRPSEQGDESEDAEEESDGRHADSRRRSPYQPAEGVSLELEVLFDSTAGLFSRDDTPEDPPAIAGFSPPEMYSSAGPSLDQASDIFSAGMTLYYLISGRRPPASIYTRHRPAIPARNFRPDFPPGLGPVVRRATRSDPEMRYPEVDSMAEAFEEALEAIEDRTAEHRDDIPGSEVSVDRHVGIAKRERNPVNQDDVFEGASENGEFGLMVVADGVSTASYGSGEVASELLIEVAEDVWNDLLPTYLMDEPIDEVDAIETILEEGNQEIVDYINERHTPFDGSAHEVMGTTALVALYHEGTVTLGSVGDSRGYLQRGPGLEQLTIDHNLWTLSILEGLPADDALSMPRGDALARCLGTFVVEEGRLEAVSPGYDIFRFGVTVGDTLLLTTDGLIDFAGGNIISAEENIQATLLAEPDPALACLELILLANRGGGGDNIGLGIAKFESPDG